VNRIDHLFPRAAPIREKTQAGDRLSLRSAARVIIALSLLLWGILLILVFQLFGNVWL
jgi:hypothetical protein